MANSLSILLKWMHGSPRIFGWEHIAFNDVVVNNARQLKTEHTWEIITTPDLVFIQVDGRVIVNEAKTNALAKTDKDFYYPN